MEEQLMKFLREVCMRDGGDTPLLGLVDEHRQKLDAFELLLATCTTASVLSKSADELDFLQAKFRLENSLPHESTPMADLIQETVRLLTEHEGNFPFKGRVLVQSRDREKKIRKSPL
ncbi:hypothetical protein HYZ99_02535 [Candidatus Peregrinibacteria bacterium]|nr:hypothetical protein [Candidatus Peregrinibacteria bacterium]